MICPVSSTTAMELIPRVAIITKPRNAGSVHLSDTAGDVMAALTGIFCPSSSGATNLSRIPCVTTLLNPPFSSGPPLIPTMWLPEARARDTWRSVVSGGKTLKGRCLASSVMLGSVILMSLEVPRSVSMCSKDLPWEDDCCDSANAWQMNPHESLRSSVPMMVWLVSNTGHARMPFSARNLNPASGSVSPGMSIGSRSMGRSPAVCLESSSWKCSCTVGILRTPLGSSPVYPCVPAVLSADPPTPTPTSHPD
mmetsp:Transcript_11824/g.28940  ORF Transcript_11824/g.28940 Transcript_11824/m.28940 type:complete len:252 (-) Transcript_11824:7-762(-)